MSDEPGRSPRRLRPDDVFWREVNDDIIVFDGRNSQYMTFNGAGQELWRGLAAGASFEDLVTGLAQTYALTSAQARVDVDAFLLALADRGLIVR